MKTVKGIKIIIEQEEDSSFHAYCPDLKGLHVCGQTRKEAMENATAAISAYQESMALEYLIGKSMTTMELKQEVKPPFIYRK